MSQRRRRELRVERQRRRGAAGGDDLGRRLRRLVDVRAREVELDRRRPSSRAHVSAYSSRGKAADRDPERDAELAQPRQRLGEEALDARVGEPDRVEHPAVGLGDPGRRLPSRGSGVTVFVTKRRAPRATSGAVSASRQPRGVQQQHAEHRSFNAQPLPARRRSRPRSRSRRRSRRPSAPPRRAGPRARAAGPPRASARGRRRGRRGRGTISSVTSVGSTTTSAFGTSAAASACHSLRNPSTAGGAPSASERYGSGAMPIPPPTSSGRATSSRKPFPSGPNTSISSPALECASARVPGPDRVDQERELPGGARQRLIGRGSSLPGASSMKNWPERPGRASRARSAPACTGRPLAELITVRRSRLDIDPLLQRQRVLRARVRDRVDRGGRAGDRRDARDARDERGLADQVAVRCAAATRRPAC